MNTSQSRPIRFASLLIFGGIFLLAAPARAAEIGWIEDYALAPDRGVPLNQLIPGSEEYYFYTCLYYQSLAQWDKADETLAAWTKRYGDTPRIREIQNRQALLTYKKDPQRALRLIQQRLNLNFNAQQEQLNPKSNLPTKLDPKLISRNRLARLALSTYPHTVQGIEPSGLDWLIATSSIRISTQPAFTPHSARLSQSRRVDRRRFELRQ